MRHLRYSGILIPHEIKLLDQFFRGTRGWDIEDYEQALMEALKANLRLGERVVVVGGGFGVTVCFAAKCVGRAGNVLCYEGNLESCKQVRQTANLNDVSSIVTVFEAIVSSDVGVYAGTKATAIIPPAEIPVCDVLQLDCEGAEAEILANLLHLPRVIIVETHGFLGAPTDSIASILTSKGYTVKDMGVAEPRLQDLCEKNDIRCLVARISHSLTGGVGVVA
jgi:hypothetical protein